MSAGTITLANNSNAVAGDGTAFTTELAAGDFIVVTTGGVTYTLPVKSIESDTALTLARNYNGPAVTAGAWTAMPRDTLNRISAQIAADTAYAIRQRVLEIDNWYQLLEVNGDVTIKMADGSSYTGPSWLSIKDTLALIDIDAVTALANQVRTDAQQVGADKQAAEAAASSAKTDASAAASANSTAQTAKQDAETAAGTATDKATESKNAAEDAQTAKAAAEQAAAAVQPENLLHKDQNLDDLPDKSAARGHLDVYSKAETDGKGGGYIGQSWWHDMRSKMPDGCVASDGQEVDQAGPFADLYADVAAGNRPTCTEAEWQADPTKRGCYVLNSSTGKMRLPDRNGVQSGSIKAPVMRGDGGYLVDGTVQRSGVPNMAGEVTATANYGLTEVGSKVTPPFKVGANNLNGFNGNGGSTTARSLIIDLSTASDVYTTGLTEARMNSLTGCFVIRYSGRAQNAGSLDAMTLSARMESINTDLLAKNVATNARVGYVLLAPSAQISVGQRLVLENPFGNSTPVIVQAELLSGNLWFNPAWLYHPNTGGYGINASYSAGEGIVVQSGSYRLNTGGMNSGGGGGTVTEQTTGTYRVHVWKVTA